MDLEELARRVAMTHNGKNYPRHMQISSMKALQEYFKASPGQPSSANKAQPDPQHAEAPSTSSRPSSG